MVYKNINHVIYIMDLNNINDRIQNEIDQDVINKLKDINLMNDYIKSPSVIKHTAYLKNILIKHKIPQSICDDIIQEYTPKLIPPSVKGCIRGNKFNYYVKKFIEDLNISQDEFEICFEKICEIYPTGEGLPFRVSPRP